MGTTLVGSPETVAKGISRLLEYSQGGFGGILFRAHEWATRGQTMRSYELFARYVMPAFQQSLDAPLGSNTWARDNRKQVFGATRLHRLWRRRARGFQTTHPGRTGCKARPDVRLRPGVTRLTVCRLSR